MNTPWIVGTILAILFFVYFERRAFNHPQRQSTLSRFIYTIGSRWPLSIFIMGQFSGGLAVHFFWHFCPAGSVTFGILGIK
jgi:hypothetical protein